MTTPQQQPPGADPALGAGYTGDPVDPWPLHDVHDHKQLSPYCANVVNDDEDSPADWTRGATQRATGPVGPVEGHVCGNGKISVGHGVSVCRACDLVALWPDWMGGRR